MFMVVVLRYVLQGVHTFLLNFTFLNSLDLICANFSVMELNS